MNDGNGYVAVEQRVGWLVPLIGVTDAWEVNVKIPGGACICGGLPSDGETRAKIPWSTRDAELRHIAQENTQVGTEDDAEPPAQTTRFRRSLIEGQEAVCLTGNMVRTMLQEAGRGIYSDDPGWFTLRRALRYNLRIEPTNFPLLRKGQPLLEPDGIMDLPRTIRRPPYERSVVQRPEFVRGPIEIHFTLAASRVGQGAIVTGEVLKALLEYSGSFLGLGSHRGIDSTPAGRPGVFEVVYFERADPGVLLPPGFAPPKLVMAEKKPRANAKTAPALAVRQEGDETSDD